MNIDLSDEMPALIQYLVLHLFLLLAKACLSSNVVEHLVSFSAIHMKLSNLYAVSQFDFFSLSVTEF